MSSTSSVSREIDLHLRLTEIEVQRRRATVMIILTLVAGAVASSWVVTAQVPSSPELVLQMGHTGNALALAFSPNGKWLASGGFDNTIRLWDVAKGQELRVILGHRGAVTRLIWSGDGRYLISAASDKTIRAWLVDTGEQVMRVVAPDKGVRAWAISPESTTLAVVGGPESSLVTIPSGTTLRKLPTGTSPIVAVSFTSDSSHLALAEASQITLLDLASSKDRKLKFERGSISTLLVRGDTIAALGTTGEVQSWEYATGRRQMQNQAPGATFVASTFAGESLVALSSGRSIFEFTPSAPKTSVAGKPLKTTELVAELQVAAFDASGAQIATSVGDGSIQIWDGRSGLPQKKLQSYTTGSYGVSFSPDARWMAAAAFDNTVRLWDLKNGEALPRLTGHSGRVTAVLFQDDKRLLSASEDRSIRFWNVSRPSEDRILTPGHKGMVEAIAISNSGNRLVSASMDATIGIWDLTNYSLLRSIPNAHKDGVYSVVITDDEKTIVSSGADQSIRLWDLETGASKGTLVSDAGSIETLSLSTGSRLVASGTADGKVKIWELATGSPVRTIDAHSGKVNSVSFTDDGKQIMSSGQDGTVKVFDLGTGALAATYHSQIGPVYGAASLAARNWTVAAGDAGINVWKGDPAKPLVTLLSMKDDDDWLTIMPDGQFDGSPQAWERLSWRFENKTFEVQPVELFFDEFFVPRLLGRLKADQKPNTTNIARKDRRQPDLTITRCEAAGSTQVTARTAHVCIDVTNAAGGAKDVRLFRNGTLVHIWRGDVLGEKGANRLETDVTIVKGPNRLTAYAFNRDNVKSTNTELDLEGAVPQQRRGTSYILAIGIDHYANKEYDLGQAVADANEFSDEMVKQQKALTAFDNVVPMVLRDDQATKSQIRETLSQLAKKIQPEDLLTIYFAGHGFAKDDHFYVVPHDIGYTGRRDNIASEGLRQILEHSISDDDLYSDIEGLDAQRVLLIIDACNSGQILGPDEFRPGPMNSKGLAQLAYEKGMYVLTASQSYQVAKEKNSLGHGYLTYALIEDGLRKDKADINGDKKIVAREWLDYAVERVPQIDSSESNAGPGRQLTRVRNAPPPDDETTLQRPRVFYRRETEQTGFQPVISEVH